MYIFPSIIPNGLSIVPYYLYTNYFSISLVPYVVFVYIFMIISQWAFLLLIISLFMSGSCHLDRESNVKICVECQIFVIFFNCGQVLQFRAHSRYYNGAWTQKRSFLVTCTTFTSDICISWKNQNKYSTLNLSFDALSKWHEPDINHSLLPKFPMLLMVSISCFVHWPFLYVIISWEWTVSEE